MYAFQFIYKPHYHRSNHGIADRKFRRRSRTGETVCRNSGNGEHEDDAGTEKRHRRYVPKMADCLRSDKSLDTCRHEALTNCPVVKKTGCCPINEGLGSARPHDREFDPLRFYTSEQGFEPAPTGRTSSAIQWQDISEILTPLGGTYSNLTTAVAPVDNEVYVSDYTLHFLALYLLSSLVRYRPNVWVHAISRSVAENIPADDGLLAIIETFLELNAVEIPQFVAEVLGAQGMLG
jgi:hypothetical protein